MSVLSLKMITWEGDLTQFLVDAIDDKDAISMAIEANVALDKYCGGNETGEDLLDESTYTVDDVDFDLLCEIVERDDWFSGKFGKTKVFNC